MAAIHEVTTACEWCKNQFVDLHLTGEKPEPHPMCDNCLNFADEEFGQREVLPL